MEKLTKEILKRMENNTCDWEKVSRCYILPEDLICKYQNKVNWIEISRYQKLSETFIRDFQDKVNWSHISRYQISTS